MRKKKKKTGPKTKIQKQFAGATPIIEPKILTPVPPPVAEPELPMDLPKTEKTSWHVAHLADFAVIPKDQIPYVAFFMAKEIKIASYKGHIIRSFTYHVGGRVDCVTEEADPLA